jgi:very-short-patch-repair endonuclease
MVSVTTWLEQCGGVASRRELVAATSRADLERALADGGVVRVARGRYALPTAHEARRSAHRLSAVAVGLSAAAHHGMLMKWQPRRPQLVVPRGRNVDAVDQKACDIRWADLRPRWVRDGWVLTPAATVVDCARRLPFDQALAVADSALRAGVVSWEALEEAVDEAPRWGSARVRRVVTEADPQAHGPFESVLRAIALEVPGLTVVPQHRIDDGHGRFIGRVDLADVRLRIVLEADSFEFHGLPELLDKDCRRYDELAVEGWLVLRFSWRQVMTCPDWVRSVLERAVALREQQRRLAV